MAAVRPLVIKAGRVRMLPASDSLDWSWLSGIPAQLALWAGIAPTTKADTFHGHAVSDVTGLQAALDAKAAAAISVTAGNGLTGGGSLAANRTLTLGTPGSISGTSANTVTATSHTHAIDLMGSYVWAGAHTFSAAITGSVSGNAGTATKLQTSRTVQVNLASTTATGFDGSANITPGVTGVLAVANGGTGANNAAFARTNLGVPSTTGSGASGSWGIAVTGNSGGLNAVTNLRGVKPNTSGQATAASVKAYFAAKEMLEGAASGTSYGDFLLLDTYSDSSGGMPNGLFFDKKAPEPAIYHYRGTWDGAAWNAPLKLSYDGHTHAIANVTGLQSALDAKANLAGGNTFTGTQVINGDRLLVRGNSGEAVRILADSGQTHIQGVTVDQQSFATLRLRGTSVDIQGNTVVSGTLQATGDLYGGFLAINGNAPGTQQAQIAFRRGGYANWQLGTESNGDMSFWSYDNSGGYLHNPINIRRTDGAVKVPNRVMAGPAAIDAVNPIQGGINNQNNWNNSGVVSACTDGGWAIVSFHRSGYTNLNLIHAGQDSLRIGSDGNAGGLELRANGDIWRGDANNRLNLRYQPRIFVQAGDPGYAATDGDLWVW